MHPCPPGTSISAHLPRCCLKVTTRSRSARSALVPSERELLPVHAGRLDLRTYEVRLGRAEAGNGPTTAGLREFVATLKVPKAKPEYLSFHGHDGTFFLVLLDAGRAVAITAVESA